MYFRACPVNNRVKFGGFDKKLNYKVVAFENLCGLKKKWLFSFKTYEHLYFRARPVTNRVKFGGFDKKTQLQSCSSQKYMRLKKKRVNCFFCSKVMSICIFELARSLIGLNLVVLTKKLNYKDVALENICV